MAASPTLDAPVPDDATSVAVTHCAHCGRPRRDPQGKWCDQCGFCPELGTCIALDEWDRYDYSSIADVPEPTIAGHLKIFWQKILWQAVRDMPPWSKRLRDSLALVVLVSVMMPLLTAATGGWRLAWVVTQIFVGTVAFVAAHVGSYLFAVLENEKSTPLDLVLRPFMVWKPTWQRVDQGKTWVRVAMGLGGLLAILLAWLFRGTMPLSAAFDAMVTERPDSALRTAVLNGDIAEEKKPRQAIAPPKGSVSAKDAARTELDCVVVGYVPRVDGGFDDSELIIAASVQGKLRYVTKVSPVLTQEERQRLSERLKKLARPAPIVYCPEQANWVEPVVTCRISYAQWKPRQTPKDVRFEKMLAELEQ